MEEVWNNNKASIQTAYVLSPDFHELLCSMLEAAFGALQVRRSTLKKLLSPPPPSGAVAASGGTSSLPPAAEIQKLSLADSWNTMKDERTMLELVQLGTEFTVNVVLRFRSDGCC